jgi:AraC family transcriptional regulator, positive regulator of tynA and feaB
VRVGLPADRHTFTVSAGQFLLRHMGRPAHFRTAPGTVARVVVLPAATLRPLLRGRAVSGPLDAPELRLLMAHATAVHETSDGLGPAGVRAASDTIIELAAALAAGAVDDAEPQFRGALVRAAKDLADRRLVEPDLSPAMLARELHVSVRTLQRAFTAGGESMTSYVRDRRLEAARRDLLARPHRPTVTELAANHPILPR